MSQSILDEISAEIESISKTVRSEFDGMVGEASRILSPVGPQIIPWEPMATGVLAPARPSELGVDAGRARKILNFNGMDPAETYDLVRRLNGQRELSESVLGEFAEEGNGAVSDLQFTASSPQPKLQFVKWPWDKDPIPGNPVPADLPVDDFTAQIMKTSPTLVAEWESLKKKGWNVVYRKGPTETVGGEQGKNGTIYIDPNYKNDPWKLTQAFAHEFGHATNPTFLTEFHTKDEHVRKWLDSEGYAALNNIKIQREIIASMGKDYDIGINGANDAASIALFNAEYDKAMAAGFPKDAQADAARVIGDYFGDHNHPSADGSLTYRQFYEKQAGK